jgi:formylglycine-generating enzyme required for sulfatase activity
MQINDQFPYLKIILRSAIISIIVFLISSCSSSRSPKTNSPSNLNESNQTSAENLKAAKAKKAEEAKSRSDYTNLIGMQFIKIQPGSFMMGSPEADEGRFKLHGPVHQVTINYTFYMAKYEVTQEEYEKVTGNNPSKADKCIDFCCDDPKCPVENVSWNDTQKFLRKLNARDAKYKYRLPSESEWEYACRAGTTTAFAFGDSLSADMANFNGGLPYGDAPKGRYLKKAVPVGSYQPNAWGLYDMHGNVNEWCEDLFQDYDKVPANGLANETIGEIGISRVRRGGMWGASGENLSSSMRGASDPTFSGVGNGFRVVAIPQH